MIVDGKKIASNILSEVALKTSTFVAPASLAVITCNPNFETQKYLKLKKNKAHALGIFLEIIHLPDSSDTEALCKSVEALSEAFDGLIIQLPLPKNIDTEKVLSLIPPKKDVDAFSYQTLETIVLPPVVGAIDEISKQHQLNWKDKKVVVFGSGKLVGAPAAHFARQQGAMVTVLTEESIDINEVTLEADIIILGVGKPNLLTPDMVKEGVVVFDAGASEDGGLLVGDASLEVASKAALFTPVPGGIGPITVALLFRNLLDLKQNQ